jgi:hypothetical protein
LMALLAIVIVGLLIYFKTPPIAIATGVLVLAVAGTLFYAGVWLANRKSGRDVDVAITGISNAVGAEVDSPEARETVARLRKKWEEMLRQKDPKYLKKWPILMILGESKSGKSCFLDCSGLDLESDQRVHREWEAGTANVDLWCFKEGVVIDTAGEMVVKEGGGARVDWPVLIGLIRKLRPRNPVSGVVLAVPAKRLLREDDPERAAHALSIQREFQRLVHGLGVRFPVSVVVTMSDLIDGYAEYAKLENAVYKQDSYSMLGWPQYKLPDEFGATDAVVESVKGTVSRLRAQVLRDICDPNAPTMQGREPLEIWSFPGNVELVGKRLHDFLSVVFKEKVSERLANAPFFRGLFFGSAFQTVNRRDPGREDIHRKRPQSDTFHLRDLLGIRLFGEAGLVTRSGRAEAAIRYRRLVGIGVPLAVAVVAGAVAWVASELAATVNKQVGTFQGIAWAVNADGAKEEGVKVADVRKDWLRHLGVKPELRLTVDTTVADALEGNLTNARNFKSQVDGLFRYYDWGSKSRGEEAKAAYVKAWDLLVARPVFDAISVEGLGAGRYHSMDLEKEGTANPELAKLDSKLRNTLEGLSRTENRGSVKPAPPPLALKYHSGAPDTQASSSTGKEILDRSLSTVVEAITQEPKDIGNQSLFAVPETWTPSKSQSDALVKLDLDRRTTLGEKALKSLESLIDAAIKNNEWGTCKAETAVEKWREVVGKVWSKFTNNPGDRLASVASYFEPLGGEQPVALLDRIWQTEPSGPTHQDLKQFIDTLDTLWKVATKTGDRFDFNDDGDKVVAQINAVPAKYVEGGAAHALALELSAAPDNFNDEQKNKRDTARATHLTPLLDVLDAKRAEFVGKILDVTDPGKPAASPKPREEGYLAPVNDIDKVVSDKKISQLSADKAAIETWKADLKTNDMKAKAESAIVKINSRLDAVSTAASGSGTPPPKAWQIVDFTPVETLENGNTWIKSVLEYRPPTGSAEQDVVKAVAAEIAKQSAALELCKNPTPPVAKGTDPKADEREKQDGENRRKITEGLKALKGTATTPIDVPAVARSLAQRSKEQLTPIREAMSATPNLSSDHEKAYWGRFWREVLTRARAVQLAAADTIRTQANNLSETFPLVKNGSSEVAISELMKLLTSAGGEAFNTAVVGDPIWKKAGEEWEKVSTTDLVDKLSAFQLAPAPDLKAPKSSAQEAADVAKALVGTVPVGADNVQLHWSIELFSSEACLFSSEAGVDEKVLLLLKDKLTKAGVLASTEEQQTGLEFPGIVKVNGERKLWRDTPHVVLGESEFRNGQPVKLQFPHLKNQEEKDQQKKKQQDVAFKPRTTELSLGKDWAPLRLALELEQGTLVLEETRDGPAYWGLLRITDTQATNPVFIFARLRLWWTAEGTNSPHGSCDINSWRNLVSPR